MNAIDEIPNPFHLRCDLVKKFEKILPPCLMRPYVRRERCRIFYPACIFSSQAYYKSRFWPGSAGETLKARRKVIGIQPCAQKAAGFLHIKIKIGQKRSILLMIMALAR